MTRVAACDPELPPLLMMSGTNKANFFGIMGYNRFWFHNDVYALTIGGGTMSNDGRYLTLRVVLQSYGASARR